MRKNLFFGLGFLYLMFSWIHSRAQEPDVTKSAGVKTIRDIPHKTFYEKWMWPHRSLAFKITKERKVRHDTAFIKSYYKRLVVTLPISNRFLRFSLLDLENGNRLKFAPNLQFNLGL